MRNLSVLSDVEFEELAADLLSAELGTPVERFAAGPDGGVDLRWRGTAIGQCKHYQRSSFPKLLAAAEKELSKVEKIAPISYVFITSFDLTVGQKEKIYGIFKDWMTGPDDVWGGRDIDGLLTNHPDVERRHPKLWVTTGMQLFWATNSGIANRAGALRAQIERSVPRYVVSEAYPKARKLLDDHNICILSGVPGIGKTALSQMLLAEYISRDFEPIEVSGDINEAWVAMEAGRRQIFFYDDFLGQISLDERLGKNEDRRLADIIERIAGSQTKKLILTTREYILRDARLSYERLADLDRRYHFVLALNDYSREDKASILYNHLWHSGLSVDCLREVAAGGYEKIIDHSAYTPRLIEYCTSSAFDLSSPGYPDRVISFLRNPQKIWQTAFQKHLTEAQRLLLLVMTTLPARVVLEDAQEAHAALCRRFLIVATDAIFRECLEVLEGTFIEIRKDPVASLTFANPSLREFALGQLCGDRMVAREIISSAPFFEQIVALVRHAQGSLNRAGNAQLNAALLVDSPLVAGALSRTFGDPSPERDWHLFGASLRLNTMESRLAFSVRESSWIPFASEWLERKAEFLMARWEDGLGDKEAAIDALHEIELAELKDLYDSVHVALDDWLEESLEDGSDWTAFTSHLARDHVADTQLLTDLAERFNWFIEEVLNERSASHVDWVAMREISDQFELHDLSLSIEEKIDQEEWEWQASERPGHVSNTLSGAIDKIRSKSRMDSLFGRLLE
ncbi:hypothetical protein P3T36_004840 [Kitasatospora sp. MAP12-15]|uniref:nSTAND3 domain-containing NTPase n=1 Tax=unclassified Kitasatospora TaxID=2633591 RepID=UPI002474A51B|nr:hypothetical protein [Kitasatospora sp. MAP12-44]MDH6110228.1 hypothetical protein [Kitasatospora sp. MAP12-44]